MVGIFREELERLFSAQIADLLKQESRDLQTNYVNLLNQIENIRQDVIKLQEQQIQSPNTSALRHHGSSKSFGLNCSPNKKAP
jgi:vacuolar-type H+-ATPase subunit D/Vma8